MESAAKAKVPDNVPAAEKLTAPAEDAPVPETVSGSADVTTPATSSVAPVDTVVVEYDAPLLPRASAAVIFTVPFEIDVVPV